MNAPATLALALFVVTSCAVEEITIATSDRPTEDGGHHRPCTINADCRPDQYCAKSSCQEAMGFCSGRPLLCKTDALPSCGCDGRTYFNDCWRQVARIASSTPGECDATAVTCGGPEHKTCPPGSYCALLSNDGPIDVCPVDPAGSCWVLPTACGARVLGDDWMPCGPPAPCVGSCDAIRSGVLHWHAAGCP
jgi:hypothetical protein